MQPAEFGSFLLQGDAWIGLEGPSFEECKYLLERAIAEHTQPTDSLINVNSMYVDLVPFISSESYRRYNDSHWLLAALDDGRVAWVSGAASEGDFVCTLRGAPFPFIVRGRGDSSFANVGDAYVHGMMHGEAWPADESDIRTIFLR